MPRQRVAVQHLGRFLPVSGESSLHAGLLHTLLPGMAALLQVRNTTPDWYQHAAGLERRWLFSAAYPTSHLQDGWGMPPIMPPVYLQQCSQGQALLPARASSAKTRP